VVAVLCCGELLSLGCRQDGASPPSSADAAAAPGSNAEAGPPGRNEEMTIEKSPFGQVDGEDVFLYTLSNAHGLVMKMTNYGATVVSLEAPDRSGKLANVTLGFATLDGYRNHDAYFGCTVGRYGNRIARGQFTLDGQQYTLATNNGPNHLHGGVKGFNRVVWSSEEVRADRAVGVRFAYRSADDEEGYPGNLDVTVTYMLTNDDEMSIEYHAVTDKPTVVNLTNHCYWNLAGAGDILRHEVMLSAERYVVVDQELIPTGELAEVGGSAMDFTEPRAIGARIAELKKDPSGPRGYDHCYVLRRGADAGLVLAARVKDPESGRVMEIRTSEPGIQFYTGNFLDGDPKNGGHQQHAAFCLETQHFPDSPHHPEFPSTVLRPDQTYETRTVHKFLVE
jgi:aldose 1-epimerase